MSIYAKAHITSGCPKCGKAIRGAGGGFKTHLNWCGTTPADRFWPKVDKSAGPEACWIWNGAVTSKWHYGCFLWTKNKVVGAHKVAWILTHGDPGPLCVLHKCDNRVCVNPAHLFLGTKRDNNLDKMAKGRQSRGETSGKAKLTEEVVREIRRVIRVGRGGNSKELATRYGVTVGTILQAAIGRRWEHVK